jgi:glutamate-1-semialdehyde 2,1-aminomutase
MEQISPAGAVYQAGTLSGNPLAMTAGLVTLGLLEQPGVYETLEERGAAVQGGLEAIGEEAGVPIVVNRVGSMLTPFFTRSKEAAVTNFAEATACSTAAYATFFHAMLEQGVYLAPSQYEAMFIGLAHEKEDLMRTAVAIGNAMLAFGSGDRA